MGPDRLGAKLTIDRKGWLAACITHKGGMGNNKKRMSKGEEKKGEKKKEKT